MHKKMFVFVFGFPKRGEWKDFFQDTQDKTGFKEGDILSIHIKKLQNCI